ncbi:MAG: DUF4381 domain-containing protein [Porticoccaceae bacterium]|nr:DUF4381 domain-containing protein [Porticoccaceae bacterium]
MNQDPLAQLRDIHLPEAIGWWPPAPGWWILTLVLLVSIAFTIRYLVRRRRQQYFRRQAQDLLTRCWESYQLKNGDRQFVEDLFTLIRRAYLSSKLSSDLNDVDNKAKNDDSKVSPDSLVEEHEDQQLKAISSNQVFKMLDHSVGGDLSKLLSLAAIEGLLYQQNPEPLKTEQTEQLYAAARRYLKRGIKQC